ncbi:multi-sensor signal transduction histidine kinase [Cellulomonas flavigena DSM 20109]|uniref:histidine kinase n=1 Tax=Cellulomonas flavigena (strain ATCC 482 / DSM 20109 / BCRC 11376 / JCM 18109 / NBRC 3775 / NCIMB 8073 / NRS 134) TaxID=446466 RepID=D5UDR7_CELFN|nr:sensor histidine kinase [Cellulomonas flavigena]ADG74475.1 multi-sensor signal transduction histidine kinase [Cellulomonas flavigena DSM 20109]
MSAARATSGRSTTLRRRLNLLLVAGGGLLGVVLVLSGFVLARALESQEAVTGPYFDAVTGADAAYMRLLDAETSVRGYVLTQDETALEPYHRSRESGVTFSDLADELAGEVPDGALVARARAAAAAAARWYDEFAEPTVARVREEGGATVSTAEVEAGRVLFDDARAAAESYVQAVRDSRAGAVDELATWTSATGGLVLLLVVAAVVAGASLWFALRRWVLLPVTQLGQASRAVTDGDLSHVVRVEGPGELEELAADVEQMRLGLVTQLAELRSSREEITEAHQRLSEQAEELRRSNRDLEQFAYVASHDLQEPLRKVASFTQLLQKRYSGQLDERADQYIDFAVDGAKRMQRLIQDLLGFSRVGRVAGDVVPVDLAAALERAQDQLSERIDEAGAAVTHDELPVVMGEERLLVQLFQNVVGNAVKFRHPDRPPRVHVSARRTDDAWEIEARDNGIGIDPQYAERVFVIFQRLHAKDVYDGTGIGLSLCKKIVEHHGGRIWIPDTDGEGTTIRWTLPVVEDETPRGGDEERS